MVVNGHVENGQIVLDQEIALQEGTKVRIEIDQQKTASEEKLSATPKSTLYERYESIIGSIKDLPPDFAAEHDHYIHGTPKKNLE